MNWWALSSLFLFSMVKFMFTPFSGPLLKLNFFETYFACVSGAIFGASVFYFSAEYFMRRAFNKRLERRMESIRTGIPLKEKKRFTRMNRLIIKIKRSIGIIGVTFWAPFFLSIPLGSIIAAKFYGKSKRTFPLIVLGIFINGLVTTGLSYLIYG